MSFVVASALAPVALQAQGSKLSVLSPLPSLRGDCRSGAPNGALARLGIAHINVFLPEKGDRRLSVATGANGEIISFSAFHNKRVGARRTESEFISMIFELDGSLRGGSHSFRVIKVPAARNEDHDLRVTPAEGAEGLALARVIARRCPATR